MHLLVTQSHFQKHTTHIILPLPHLPPSPSPSLSPSPSPLPVSPLPVSPPDISDTPLPMRIKSGCGLPRRPRSPHGITTTTPLQREAPLPPPRWAYRGHEVKPQRVGRQVLRSPTAVVAMVVVVVVTTATTVVAAAVVVVVVLLLVAAAVCVGVARLKSRRSVS